MRWVLVERSGNLFNALPRGICMSYQTRNEVRAQSAQLEGNNQQYALGERTAGFIVLAPLTF
jgi:hypothetical protein